MRSWCVVLGIVGLAAASAGCPRVTPPPNRMGGMPCDTHADCNPDVDCGELSLCVTNLCETGRSLIVPCPGEGERVP